MTGGGQGRRTQGENRFPGGIGRSGVGVDDGGVGSFERERGGGARSEAAEAALDDERIAQRQLAWAGQKADAGNTQRRVGRE